MPMSFYCVCRAQRSFVGARADPTPSANSIRHILLRVNYLYTAISVRAFWNHAHVSNADYLTRWNFQCRPPFTVVSRLEALFYNVLQHAIWATIEIRAIMRPVLLVMMEEFGLHCRLKSKVSLICSGIHGRRMGSCRISWALPSLNYALHARGRLPIAKSRSLRIAGGNTASTAWSISEGERLDPQLLYWRTDTSSPAVVMQRQITGGGLYF